MTTPRPGLVAVKRFVTRQGKTYETTLYVKPEEAAKMGNHTIQVPDWKLTHHDHVQDVANAIAKVKDPVEKKILKQHFLEHIEQHHGVTWKKDTGVKADDINWMRGLMAIKTHLKANSGTTSQPQAQQQQQQKPTPAPAQQQQSGGKVIGGTPMSKEDAKKLVQELRAQMGMDGVMDMARANGIKWAENPNHKANSYMQCAMKLSKHLQAGGTLRVDAKVSVGQTAQTQQQKAPAKAQPKQQKVTNPGPPPGTLEHDWYHATPQQKAIGMLTGMIPLDKKTTDYLVELIKNKEFDLGLNDPIKLPRAYERTAEYFANHMLKNSQQTRRAASRIYDLYGVENIFKGTDLESAWKTYHQAIENFHVKYGRDMFEEGVEALVAPQKLFSVIEKGAGRVPDFASGQTMARYLKESIDKAIKGGDAEIDRIWDELGLEDWINDDSPRVTPMKIFCDLVDKSRYNYGESRLRTEVANMLGTSAWRLIHQYNSGNVNKRQILGELSKQLDVGTTYHASYCSDKPIKDRLNDGYTGEFRFACLQRYMKDMQHRASAFSSKAYADAVAPILNDWKDLVTPEARAIEVNLALHRELRSSSGSLKPLEDYKAIPFSQMSALGVDTLTKVRRHIQIMRQPADKRDKYAEKLDKKLGTDVIDVALGGDTSAFKAPKTHKEAGIKAGMMAVPDDEAAKVEAKIQATHDRINHGSFRTKVHGVYRIVHMPGEEDFQAIDKARNNTGFYYHGTSYISAQKIIGQSGGFKVFSSNSNAKGVRVTGRMLGDGVYLASESSKSMQYAGRGSFSRGNDRGVLFLCKASLGKVVELDRSQRGHHYANPILQQPNVDTTAMMRPHVLNPEWCVKDPKAVIPRLWIDAEKV